MRLTTFDGLYPKIDGQDLPAKAALVAENCDLYSGRIDPHPALGGAESLVDVHGALFTGTAITIYRAGSTWVAWDHHVFVVPDETKRGGEDTFLFVDDGRLWRSSPRFIKDGAGPVPIGVGAPALPPQAAVSSGLCAALAFPSLPCGPDTGSSCAAVSDGRSPKEVRAYLMTYITGCDEESAPSPPTPAIEVDVNAGDGVLLVDPNLPPPEAAKRRWYRSVVDAKGSAVWLFVAEIDISVLAYTDCVPALALGEAMRVEDHLPPPECLEGVALLGNTSVVVWAGNSFWISEPRLPHAYPPQWKQSIPQRKIVFIAGVTPSTEGETTYLGYIGTTGRPYYVAGALPESARVSEMAYDCPAVSARAWTAVEGAVVYASTHGLVQTQQGQLGRLLDAQVTDIEWAKLAPHDMHMAAWNGRLWVFGPQVSWVIPVSRIRQDRAAAMTTLTLHPTACFAGAEVPLTLADGAVIRQWGAGTGRMRARWRSERFTMPGTWWPAAMKVVVEGAYRKTRAERDAEQEYAAWAANHPRHPEAFFDLRPELARLKPGLTAQPPYLRVKIIADGVTVMDRPVPANVPFRVPRYRRGIDWEFEVTSNVPVIELHADVTIQDLTQLGMGVSNSV
ncbi:MAG: hypothetical protein JSS23_11200 [Proteobacteria bacterium]|nr:hypothetical protein [Pseudomonadota bacterium]